MKLKKNSQSTVTVCKCLYGFKISIDKCVTSYVLFLEMIYGIRFPV